MLSPYSLPLSLELILSTSEVQALTGAKPKGEEWARGAFLFVGEGKIGEVPVASGEEEGLMGRRAIACNIIMETNN
jgi:hypothetical protein